MNRFTNTNNHAKSRKFTRWALFDQKLHFLNILPHMQINHLKQHIQHGAAISGVFWAFQWTASQIPRITRNHANSRVEPYLTESCTFSKNCPTCRLTTLKQHIQHVSAILSVVWAFQQTTSQIPKITQNPVFSPICPKVALSREIAPHAD